MYLIAIILSSGKQSQDNSSIISWVLQEILRNGIIQRI